MKISFSTLGLSNFSWKVFNPKDIYSAAKDLNFNGIEIYGLGECIHIVKGGGGQSII
jgi:hypothetical protein